MMMYQTVQSFIDDYGKETELTLKALDALTDESLGQEVAPGYRTLGHLAWHLIPSGGILQPLGLEYEAPAEGDEPPASVPPSLKLTGRRSVLCWMRYKPGGTTRSCRKRRRYGASS
ncbi:DinB family protein [Paenibacillus sp. P26]|nr:DinB family protein [Paenibacillus sp. P26]